MTPIVAAMIGYSISNRVLLFICSICLGLLHGAGSLVRHHDAAAMLGLPEPDGERVFLAAILGVLMLALSGRILRTGLVRDP